MKSARWLKYDSRNFFIRFSSESRNAVLEPGSSVFSYSLIYSVHERPL